KSSLPFGGGVQTCTCRVYTMSSRLLTATSAKQSLVVAASSPITSSSPDSSGGRSPSQAFHHSTGTNTSSDVTHWLPCCRLNSSSGWVACSLAAYCLPAEFSFQGSTCRVHQYAEMPAVRLAHSSRSPSRAYSGLTTPSYSRYKISESPLCPAYVSTSR